jgi:hypothetical protein
MTSPVIWQHRHDLGSWMMPATQILSLYCHMTGEVIIQLPRLCLYWHMTGEVIIQLPRYCLYTVIWLEKSSSSYPDTVSILSYDRRSHHPATQILSLYCPPVICQYRDSIRVAGWWLLQSYDSIETWSGSWMMTSPVICQHRDSIQIAGWWLLLSYVSIETWSSSWMMTSVIWHYRDMIG